MTTGKRPWRLSKSGRRKEIFNLAAETIARAHLKFPGSLEGVARAKGELWEELRKEDWMAVHADDERVANLAGDARCLKKSFGVEKPLRADVTERHAWGFRKKPSLR